MSAGELKHDITIQYDDSDGTTTPNWVDLLKTKAAKKGLKGRLFYQAAAMQSENNVQFIIRFKAGINPKMLIIDNEYTYEIIADPVDPDGVRRWLEINCRRISSNGC
jgi:SPP1 family predicted phage head-tail adaptor